MTKNFTIVILLFSFSAVIAQQSNNGLFGNSHNPSTNILQISNQASECLLDSTTRFDNAGNLVGLSLFIYDSQDSVSEEWYKIRENNQWVNSYREIHAYNGQGNLLTQTHQDWIFNEWVVSSRISYEYDGQGQVTTKTYQNGTGLPWVNAIRFLHTYDGQGNLTETIEEQWDENTNTWNNESRATFTYSNGDISEQIQYNWNGSTWVNHSLYIYDYNGQSLLSELTSQTWNGSDWGDATARVIYTYDAQGNLTTHTNQFFNSGNWDNITRNVYTYNNQGDVEEINVESWNGNAWSLQGTYQSVYNCEGVGLSELILESNIFPNPSTGLFSLEAIGNISYQLFDSGGRLVLSNTATGNTSVDISSQPSGIYTLLLQTSGGSAAQKLVKN
jgi:hypothetical protein